MWYIQEETSGNIGVADLALDCSQYGKGFPEGSNDKEEQGFSFFEVRIINRLPVEEYITSRISADPNLIAVTQSQYDDWKKKGIVIVAKPCTFTWGPERFI